MFKERVERFNQLQIIQEAEEKEEGSSGEEEIQLRE